MLRKSHTIYCNNVTVNCKGLSRILTVQAICVPSVTSLNYLSLFSQHLSGLSLMRSQKTIRDVRVAGSDYLWFYMSQIVGVNSKGRERRSGPMAEHSSCLSPPAISSREASKVFAVLKEKPCDIIFLTLRFLRVPSSVYFRLLLRLLRRKRGYHTAESSSLETTSLQYVVA